MKSGPKKAAAADAKPMFFPLRSSTPQPNWSSLTR